VHRSTGVLNGATGEVHSFREIAEMVAAQVSEPPAIQGSPRSGPMPHNGYRPFDPAATFRAFPDFRYTRLADGLALTHKRATATA
jgi:nucleoside-diphosphate-sugar epimerase